MSPQAELRDGTKVRKACCTSLPFLIDVCFTLLLQVWQRESSPLGQSSILDLTKNWSHPPTRTPLPQGENMIHCCSPSHCNRLDWDCTVHQLLQLQAAWLLCTDGRQLKPSLVLLSPLRIESASLSIMKLIPSPEQRLEASGKYRSRHKKAGASIIYIVSSLAIYVWGPKVMTSWLRCYKQDQTHGPETPWRLARCLC